MVLKEKRLYCGNDIVESIKSYGLIELKLFYNMIYYDKEYKTFRSNEYDIEEGSVQLELYDLKRILGTRYSELELERVINGLPNKIKLRGDKVGFISVYDYAYYDRLEQVMKYKLNKTFLDYADIQLSFSKLELNEFSRLRSTYSQRLYELYRRYKGIDKYTMRIEQLYEYFNISSKTNISEVARRGLDPAINELRTKTKFTIAYRKIKKSHKITHIVFDFT